MTDQNTRICLVGATGLVGTALIARSVGCEAVRLIGIARREVRLPTGARMEMLVAQTPRWPQLIAAARADVLVCALGTTLRAAGSREAFRAIDHALVLRCAEAARDAGIAHMILVSSVGADPASRSFYLSVKGETEEALGRLGFRRLDVLRPSLLRGRREGWRPLEAAAQVLAPLADLMLHGRARRYRSIRARQLAAAVLTLAQARAPGRFVHEHDEILQAARGG